MARQGPFTSGLALDAPIQLESASRDTLQNLRNARASLGRRAQLRPDHESGPPGPLRVTRLSSRYHLARCALFARQLGFDAELCAAESRLHWGPRTLRHIAGEAAYVCMSDMGARWARLIGHRGMLEGLS